MPAITTNDLKNGITLELDNGLFQVVEFQHVKPGKGGAFVRTKLRNVKTGNVFDRTFNAGVRVEQAIVNRTEMQFLYRDGDDYVFMDNQNYEQTTVTSAALADVADYLVEGMTAQLGFHNNVIISAEIPASVELTIAETEPGVQGDRVSGARKQARARDGQGSPGAAVRRDRRQGQGRHAHGRVHDACLMERPDARSDARERALYLLYEAQAKGIEPAATIELQVIEPDAMTTDLVVGVGARVAEIDAAIADKARDWPLTRMPVIDLSVMRLATYELMARPDVPLAVVIDEAVELAKRFSTDHSGRFVNGVLAAIAADVRRIVDEVDH